MHLYVYIYIYREMEGARESERKRATQRTYALNPKASRPPRIAIGSIVVPFFG